jgi:predicted  nucleic acid-binding Zn-ribbon protein
MSPVYHAATPSLSAHDAPVRSSSLAALPVRSSSLARKGRAADEKQHDVLLQRIRELEAKNRELEADTTAHSTRITALRASHAAVVESLEEAHAVELSALRKSTHWPAIVDGKERELELLRSNSEKLVARLTLLEQLLRERDRQVEWLREGCEPEVDVDVLLEEERKRNKEELAFVVQEEEKRRAELNWLFGEKIEKVEALRRTERAELEARLEQLQREKEALEEMQFLPKTTGTDELMAMVKTLNTRLAEATKKNQKLEATMSQITDEAWFSVSDSKHSIQKLKHDLEDKDAALTHLQREHDIAKRERAEFEDAWKRVCCETSVLQQSVDDRDERIRDLEEESGALRDALEQSRAELEQQQQQNDVHEDILVKLAQSSYSASSRESSRSPTGDESADLQQLVYQLRRDIKLYRSDIRAYKRDVKERDKTIVELQSQLSSPVADDHLLKEFPAPPPQQRLKEENEALTALVKQQARALEEMDEKMRLLQGEKELLVRRMQQGMRKVSGGRPRLPSVGEAAPPPPPPKKSPQLPPQEEQGEVFVW